MKLLVGSDLTSASSIGLKAAVAWSHFFRAELTVLHIEKFATSETLESFFTMLNINVEKQYVDEILAKKTQELRLQFEQVVGGEQAGLRTSFVVRGGSPVYEFVDFLRECEAKLVVLGHSSSENQRGALRGSFSEAIFHRSDKSILLAKNEGCLRPKKIVVAFDFSSQCESALAWALKLAKTKDLEIHLVNVAPCYFVGYHNNEFVQGEFGRKVESIIDENIRNFEEKLKSKAQALREDGYNVIETVLLDREGNVSDKLVQYEKENSIDLIFIGPHMKGRIKELLLGSVALGALKKSQASIFIAR